MEEHILVVDDSPTIRSAVSFCLRNAGYEVSEAKDGKDGLKKLESMKESRQGLALIVTDINMPQMDGIAFIKNVKKSNFRFLPILVFTTESKKSILEKGRAVGASGWLVKPFQPEQLLWAVKKLVWPK